MLNISYQIDDYSVIYQCTTASPNSCLKPQELTLLTHLLPGQVHGGGGRQLTRLVACVIQGQHLNGTDLHAKCCLYMWSIWGWVLSSCLFSQFVQNTLVTVIRSYLCLMSTAVYVISSLLYPIAHKNNRAWCQEKRT